MDFDTFWMDEGANDVPGAPRDDPADGLRERLDALPPEERTAWLLYLALEAKEETDRRLAARADDPGRSSPALARAAESARRQLDEVVGRARDEVARNPPGPETLRRIEEGLLLTAGRTVIG